MMTSAARAASKRVRQMLSLSRIQPAKTGEGAGHPHGKSRTLCKPVDETHRCAARSRSIAAETAAGSADGRVANGSDSASSGGRDWPPTRAGSASCA